MQSELVALQPQLVKTVGEVEQLMVKISKEKAEVVEPKVSRREGTVEGREQGRGRGERSAPLHFRGGGEGRKGGSDEGEDDGPS